MTRCSNCSGKNACVAGDGPGNARVVGVGEAPGKTENRSKRVFDGKTGEELNRHYLQLANLERGRDIYLTNAIKCLPDSTDGRLDIKREKDLDLLYSCTGKHLMREISQAKPKLIVPMGAFACHAIDPNIDLELHHGIPLQTDWGIAFPQYHPAGGIHEPKKMLQIRTDWIRLGKYLRDKLTIPSDPFHDPDYALTDARGVREYLHGYEGYPLACDTEIYRSREPYCITFSIRPGSARLIRAEDTAALEALQHYLDNWEEVILWHNWLFDYPVTLAMRLRFPHHRIVDTMVKVFHLGNLPQGLKALAYRELGMTMQDFDDLVTPYSSEHVLNFYKLARMQEWGKPDEQVIRDPKTGKHKLYTPQGFNTKLKRFFTDYSKNPSKNIFEMWTKNWDKLHETVEERLGPWPGKCISHAPFEEILYYACRDADALLRLWPIIKKSIRQMRKRPQEYWSGALAA